MALPRPRAAALEHRSRAARAVSLAHRRGCRQSVAPSLPLRETPPRFDDVLGPPPHFIINPANILPHYSQRQHLDTTEERNDDHDGRVAYRKAITRDLHDEIRE